MVGRTMGDRYHQFLRQQKVQEIVFPLPLKPDGNSRIKNEPGVRGEGVWERKEEKRHKLSQGSCSLVFFLCRDVCGGRKWAITKCVFVPDKFEIIPVSHGLIIVGWAIGS